MSKYQFNRDQLRFMEVGKGIKDVIRRILMVVVGSMLLAVIYYFLFSSFFNTSEEQQLIRENRLMVQEYDRWKDRIEEYELVLDNLEERDKDVYRTLFKSDPPNVEQEMPSSFSPYPVLPSAGQYDLVFQTDTIYKKLVQKAERVDELFEAIALSISPEKVASIPNMIPLRDLDISRVGATIGERMHPFYKTVRMHHGLDFITALGADVLAPANGTVTDVSISSRGSGNTLTIEHGFGYRTVYAHLRSVSVRKGQEVTKGMIIARAGDTGMSLIPHLHYEIWKGDKLMNPIHFCYSRLSPKEYTQLMIAGYNSGQSLD